MQARLLISSGFAFVPAAVILAIAWRRANFKITQPKPHAALWFASISAALYPVWVATVLVRFLPLVLLWPMVAVPFSVLGLGLALLAKDASQWKVAIANGFLLLAAVGAMVAPN